MTNDAQNALRRGGRAWRGPAVWESQGVAGQGIQLQGACSPGHQLEPSSGNSHWCWSVQGFTRVLVLPAVRCCSHREVHPQLPLLPHLQLRVQDHPRPAVAVYQVQVRRGVKKGCANTRYCTGVGHATRPTRMLCLVHTCPTPPFRHAYSACQLLGRAVCTVQPVPACPTLAPSPQDPPPFGPIHPCPSGSLPWTRSTYGTGFSTWRTRRGESYSWAGGAGGCEQGRTQTERPPRTARSASNVRRTQRGKLLGGWKRKAWE